MKETRQGRFWGETTAFLALFLDNVGVLVFLSSILVFTFNYPADMVLTRMIPGTAMGVLFGDLVPRALDDRLGLCPAFGRFPDSDRRREGVSGFPQMRLFLFGGPT